MTTAGGRNPANPNGNATIEVAATNTVMCAKANQIPGAKTQAERCRTRSTAEAIAAKERNQFTTDQADHTSTRTDREMRKAAAGVEILSGDTAPPIKKAARPPTPAASAPATRRKLSPTSEHQSGGLSSSVAPPADRECWLSRK